MRRKALIVILSIIGIVLLICGIRIYHDSRMYTLYFATNFVGGLKEGDDIVLKGQRIGYIKDVEFNQKEYKVWIKGRINKNQFISEGSTVLMSATLGQGRLLVFSPGKRPYYKDGDVISINESIPICNENIKTVDNAFRFIIKEIFKKNKTDDGDSDGQLVSRLSSNKPKESKSASEPSFQDVIVPIVLSVPSLNDILQKLPIPEDDFQSLMEIESYVGMMQCFGAKYCISNQDIYVIKKNLTPQCSGISFSDISFFRGKSDGRYVHELKLNMLNENRIEFVDKEGGYISVKEFVYTDLLSNSVEKPKLKRKRVLKECIRIYKFPSDMLE